MNRCATCRHWTRNRVETRNAAGELAVDPSHPWNRFGSCALLTKRSGEEPPADRVNYPSGNRDDYFAGLQTGEAFGCVHWTVAASGG